MLTLLLSLAVQPIQTPPRPAEDAPADYASAYRENQESRFVCLERPVVVVMRGSGLDEVRSPWGDVAGVDLIQMNSVISQAITGAVEISVSCSSDALQLTASGGAVAGQASVPHVDFTIREGRWVREGPPGGLLIREGPTFPISFDPGSAELYRPSLWRIERAAAWIAQTGSTRVSVVGHTDTVGSPDANQRLSERRAQAVRDALVAAGVDPAIITATGRGETDLAVPSEDEQVEPMNRRVDIDIIFPPRRP